jgi:hypothetical protein
MHTKVFSPGKERNIHYVVEIEVWLAKTMEFMPVNDDDDDDIP